MQVGGYAGMEVGSKWHGQVAGGKGSRAKLPLPVASSLLAPPAAAFSALVGVRISGDSLAT